MSEASSADLSRKMFNKFFRKRNISYGINDDSKVMWVIICREMINVHMIRIFDVPMTHRSGSDSSKAVITRKVFVELKPFDTSMLTF